MIQKSCLFYLLSIICSIPQTELSNRSSFNNYILLITKRTRSNEIQSRQTAKSSPDSTQQIRPPPTNFKLHTID